MVEAQLATVKAKAESAKADAELKVIANLVSAKRALDQKVLDLKKASEASFQQAKTDVDAGQRERRSRLAPACGFGRTMPRRRIVETSDVRLRPSRAAAPCVPPITQSV